MNAETKPRDMTAHWRATLDDLAQRIAAADVAIENAQHAASAAALEGGDLPAATRALAHARDVADALRSASGEAERHLADAVEAAAQRDRDRALERARAIARQRIELADSFDAYARELDPLFARWIAAGSAYAREVSAAGLRPPSGESRDYRLRSALWATAPGFMAAIGAPRVSLEHRVTLRQITAAQVAPILAKGE